MAMSRAYRGLKLPDYKRQRCGHFFNAAGCKVCIQCLETVRPRPKTSIRCAAIDRVHFAVAWDLLLIEEELIKELADPDIARQALRDGWINHYPLKGDMRAAALATIEADYPA